MYQKFYKSSFYFFLSSSFFLSFIFIVFYSLFLFLFFLSFFSFYLSTFFISFVLFFLIPDPSFFIYFYFKIFGMLHFHSYFFTYDLKEKNVSDECCSYQSLHILFCTSFLFSYLKIKMLFFLFVLIFFSFLC